MPMEKIKEALRKAVEMGREAKRSIEMLSAFGKSMEHMGIALQRIQDVRNESHRDALMKMLDRIETNVYEPKHMETLREIVELYHRIEETRREQLIKEVQEIKRIEEAMELLRRWRETSA